MGMDRDERRRLKKLGKQIVADRSRELQDHLREANPAPIGSVDWGENYREGILKERELRSSPRDRFTATELAESFVPNPVPQGFREELFGVRGYFWRCGTCGDVVNSLPAAAIRCRCGNITVDPVNRVRAFESSDQVQMVTLIGKGTSRPKGSGGARRILSSIVRALRGVLR